MALHRFTGMIASVLWRIRFTVLENRLSVCTLIYLAVT